MIRVLQIVTDMRCGGLETMIMNYNRKIDRTKIQFDFLVHRQAKGDYEEEIKNLGGKIYRLPRLDPWSFWYRKQLDRFFKEHTEYQVVHCHLDCMAGIPLFYAKKHGVPVRIAHAHSSSQTKDFKYLAKLWFRREITKNATHLFACGEKAGNFMFRTNQYLILNNAIDCKKYMYTKERRKDMRKKIGISNDATVYGHVGRFDVPKNHTFLIDIFAEIKKRDKKAMLLLVGDGALRKKMEKKVKKLGLCKSVWFLGKREDVPMLLQAMDAFLFPSIYEGLPLSVIEAQAAGLPCFLSRNVPEECKKTELVQRISLKISAKEWAERICGQMKEKGRERKNTGEEIRKAGFDIERNAKWLQQFYLEEVKKAEGDG